MTSAGFLGGYDALHEYAASLFDTWSNNAGFELAAAAPPPVLLAAALAFAALSLLFATRMWILVARRLLSGCTLAMHHVHEVRIVAQTSSSTELNPEQWRALTKAVVGCSRAQSVYDPGTVPNTDIA